MQIKLREVAVFNKRHVMCCCRCSEDIDECVSEPCQHDGVCIDRVNGYECNCTTNYSGLICEFDVSKFAVNLQCVQAQYVLS